MKCNPLEWRIWFIATLLSTVGPVLTPSIRAADPDVTPPAILKAGNLGDSQVRLVFSEPVAAPAANDVANYALNGGIRVLSALLADNATNVTLTVTPLTLGQAYTLRASNLSDLAVPPNLIGTGNSAAFVAMEVYPEGVGFEGGTVKRVGPDSFDITGGGTDIGGNADHFQFAWSQRSGNFDVQVRVSSITLSSQFVHAGLMARSTADANSPFAAVFASSVEFGCFFESRGAIGIASSQQSIIGGFPANYPFTYLRLRRSGNVFTGFASHDGQGWVQLSSTTLTLPASLQLGLAVCGQNASSMATATFKEYGSTRSQTVVNFKPDRESMGPSSRRTGLVFSEIQYFPRPDQSISNSLEFIEIHNTSPVFEDLTGWRISGGVDYRFPDKTVIPAGGVLVVAADPEALQKSHGIQGVLGPFHGSLNNNGDTLRLRDHVDAIRLEMTYSADAPWPVAARGTGHSLVLLRPSYGENDSRAWGLSERIGGTPGEIEAVVPSPYRSVLINEFLAHTDDPQLDFVELYNRSNVEVDLSRCVLTDDPSTNRFSLPAGTVIPPRGFLVFDQNKLGFRLKAAGEAIYLINPDGTRVIDSIAYEGQENGVSSGRSPDGSGTIRRLASPTPGASNASWRQEEIVINEIMYHPISGDSADEYLEFYNRGTAEIDLGGWRLNRGVGYEIPKGIRLAPGKFLVVAKNVNRLRSRHPHLNAANSVGDFSGTLGDSKDHVALSRPIAIVSTNNVGLLVTNTTYAVITETAYYAGGRWGYYSDGGGSSLELIDPNADPLRASNWADSDESQKAAWQTVEFTGPLDNGQSSHQPNRFRISMLGAGECLVDDVEIFKVGSTNLINNNGFENGSSGWTLGGNHSTSFIQSGGAFSGNNCLHVIAQGDGDTGINAIRSVIASGATGIAPNNQATIRARVRWLAGWPEVLFRTRGNWIELPARMNVPANLGTPGLPNSRKVLNAGPAIYEVSHSPALPRANQAVVVTCRVSDPDGFGGLKVRYRVDPSSSYREISMRDDGSGGDEVAGDGLYSATLPGQTSGSLVAFVISATDAAPAEPATNLFPNPVAVLPAATPGLECLIRWDDPVPFGSLGHYHIWNTQNTQGKRSNALNNTFRDCTLVYGNTRVIYNAGFRDKGSPYHGGGGDYAVTVPSDDKLLGVTDRVFGSTGNGGTEETGLRGRLSAWIGARMGIPYLHAHYIRVFRNGSQHQNVSEDVEQPNTYYAESQFPSLGGDGDLHKLAVWFEFQDDNSGFDAVGATLERFTSGGVLKPSRYRWNWQRRPKDGTANNMTNVLELVTAANATTDYATRMLQLADMEEWMRVFAYHRILGNWDSYNFSVGQNMFAYKVTGERWRLLPWDIDFVLGLGNGPSDPLGAGTFGGASQDPIGSRMFNEPAFRRALWRAHIDAANGPLLVENYSPQIGERRNALLQNGVQGLSATNSIYTYINSRRTFILNQARLNDTNVIVVTNLASTGFTTAQPSITLGGFAPFAAAGIEVNGIPYPVTWTSQRSFSIIIPLTQRTNELTLSGVDRFGTPITNAPASVKVVYTGAVDQPQGRVVINEIQFHPLNPGSSFIELYNTSSTTPFDLSGFRLDGAGYVFREGSIIPKGGYLLLVSDRRAFAQAYGNTIAVFDEFSGSLDNGGEHLRLIQPGAGNGPDVVISDVRYDDQLPWPLTADGLGPSLQLIDPGLGSYRVGNWAAAGTNDSILATPGRVNSVRQGLQDFPSVWLNEVLPNNLTGPLDNAGEREPFVELYNSGTESIDLSGLFLTDNFTNLTQWRFPTGAAIAPKSFLLVWLDAQPQQSDAVNLHAGFRPNPTNGVLGLVRLQGGDNSPAVVDYLEYRQLPSGRSFGSVPDGEPRDRRSFTQVTPGASNNPSFGGIRLSLNEFMAANLSSIADPVDGERKDWIEIYNPGAAAVDLTSFKITDSPLSQARFTIPSGYVVPANGFLLVWADSSPKLNSPTNADLHVNFKLSSTGGFLGLYSPDGQKLDEINYGPQKQDASAGRFPDGSQDPLIEFELATPRAPNVVAGGNRPPVLASIPAIIAAEQTLVTFTAAATDPDAGQHLVFSLGPDAPQGSAIDARSGSFEWTPSEVQGPGNFLFSVRVSDDGIPVRVASRQVSINVLEANRRPVVEPAIALDVDEGTQLLVKVKATDPDFPANKLRFVLEPGAPDGLSIDESNGDLSWLPQEKDGPGVYTVGVRVIDDGVPALSASSIIKITVNEVNNPPIMETIQPQSVDELSSFRYAVKATDPDDPSASLIYSLAGGPPSGMTIDPATGVIQWTPSESDGPSRYLIQVRVTEKNAPQLSSVQQFGLTVNEVNQLPVVSPVNDLVVEAGVQVRLKIGASDADLPLQRLIYSLGSGAPKEASIDSATGLFEWLVPSDQVASTNRISVRVLDDFTLSPGTSTEFVIVVRPKFKVSFNEVQYRSGAGFSEYVEFVNSSTSTAADLSGYRLVGRSLDFTFPNGIRLTPGGLICVVRDPQQFRAAYGPAPAFAGAWTGQLGIVSDELKLIAPGAGGAVMDRVSYRSTLPWPSTTNLAGSALQAIDPSRDRSRVANWSVAQNYNGPRALVSITNKWRYYQTGPLEASWKNPGFDDGAWKEGQALLYVEDAALPAPKSTALTLGQNAYYFRTPFVIPTVPKGASLVLSNIVDDGAVFYLNGREIHRQGIDPGPVEFGTAGYDFRSPKSAVGDASWAGPFVLPVDGLEAGTNVLAVEVHQVSSTSSDIVFGCTLEIQGGTLATSTPGGTNSVAGSLEAFPPVWINEVLPSNLSGLKDGTGKTEPWIELINTGDVEVRLDGLFLSADYSNPLQWAFPAGAVIRPLGTLIVFADGEPGQGSRDELHAGFRLNAISGSVILSRLQEGSPAVLDYLDYSGLGANVSLASVPDGQGFDRFASNSPTPGGLNSPQTNHVPVLSPVPVQTTRVGDELLLNPTWSDPDSGQTILFSIDPPVPAGLILDPATGRLSWRPGDADLGTHNFTLRVTDNGQPTLSASQVVVVVVMHDREPPVLGVTASGDGTILLSWKAPTGSRFSVESKGSLGNLNWVPFAEVTSASGQASINIRPAGDQQYFRVVVR